MKSVDLPQEMQRAIARQAEAERETRATIIHADGELIASEKPAAAAAILAREPASVTLTLTEIPVEQTAPSQFRETEGRLANRCVNVAWRVTLSRKSACGVVPSCTSPAGANRRN